MQEGHFNSVRLDKLGSDAPMTSDKKRLSVRKVKYQVLFAILLVAAATVGLMVVEYHRLIHLGSVGNFLNQTGRQRTYAEQMVRIAAGDPFTDATTTSRAFRTVDSLLPVMEQSFALLTDDAVHPSIGPMESSVILERRKSVIAEWEAFKKFLPTSGQTLRPPQLIGLSVQRDRLIESIDLLTVAVVDANQRQGEIEAHERVYMSAFVCIVLLAAWFLAAQPGLRMLAAQADGLETQNARFARILARLRSLQAAMDQHSLVTIGDVDGTILEANDLFCRATGYTRQELIGHNHRIVNAGVHSPEFWSELYLTVTAGETWQGEVCNRNRNGSLGWYATTVTPVLDSAGQIEFMIALRTDVTRFNEMKGSLTATSARLEAILSALPDAVFDLDSEGRILQAKAGLNTHRAIIASAQPGTNLAQALPANVSDQLHGALLEVQETKESAHGRFTLALADGLCHIEYTLSERAVGEREVAGRFVLVLSDVTARRRMEDALIGVNRRFALAQQSMNLAVWEWNGETGAMLWDSPTDVFGPSSELPSTRARWASFIHPDDREAVAAVWSHAIEQRIDFAAEFRIQLNRGAERWVAVTGTPVGYSDRDALRYVGLMADIDDRQRLKQVTERLSLVAQRSSNAVVITDPAGLIEWVNEGFTRITGWELHEVVGKKPAEMLVGPDTDVAASQVMSWAVANEEPCKVEIINYHRDGTPYWVLIEIEPLKDADGTLTGFMAIESDIHTRVLAQQCLAAESQRLQFAMIVGGLLMWEWDVPSGRVVLSSSNARLGLEEGPTTDQISTIAEIESLIDPEDWKVITDRMELHFAGETPDFSVVYRHRGPEGTIEWKESRGRVSERDEAGNPVCVVGTTATVTDRLMAAEKLAESERRFRTLADSTPAIIWVTNADGEVTYFNQRWLEFTGSDRIDLDSWESAVHPDEQASVSEYMRVSVQDRVSFESHYRCRRADGEYRWMLDRGVPNIGTDGTLHGYVGTILDITEQREAEDALAGERARLAAFVEHAPAAIAMFDRDMRYITHSHRWLVDYGIEGELLLGRTHYDVFTGMPEHWRAEHERALAGEVRRNESDTWRPEGWEHDQILRWEMRPWIHLDGSIGGILIFTEDITTIKAIEQTLRANETKFRSLFELAPVGLSLNRLDTLGFLQTNQALQTITGYSEDEFRNSSLWDAVAEVSQAEFKTLAESLLRDGATGAVELELRRKDGLTVPVLINSLVIHDETGAPTSWSIIQDISEQRAWEEAVSLQFQAVEYFSETINSKKEELEQSTVELRRLNEQLEHQSVTDPLTGLPNRRGFNQRLDAALVNRRGRSGNTGIAALFMDLDNFKFINDSLGHEAGDQLLIQVAQRTSASLRDGGLVGRFAGDEFTVLLPIMPDARTAMQVADRILEAMRAPFTIEGTQMAIRFSIGVAFFECEIVTAEGLLRDADAALYVAKDRGKGQSVLFEPWMHATAERRRQLEMELRQAIESREIRAVFQPIINLDTYTIHAVEALMRWDHPTEGLLAPAQFLDIAEEAGLMGDLGNLVLRQLAPHLINWTRADGSHLRVFLNVSSQEFNDRTYLDRLHRTIQEYGIDPSWLVLEITEGTLMADYVNASERLQQMRAMGFGTAMDDFGAGQSSLGRLSAIPVDIVKTDRSLTAQISQDFRTLAVVRAISALCHAIGVEVLAEGVEDEDALVVAMSVGCRYAQGYHLSVPLTAEEFNHFQADWRSPEARAKAS